MLTISEHKVNNWLFYRPDGFYCTVQSITPFLYVSGVTRHNLRCEIHDLTPVRLNESMTTLFIFVETTGAIAKQQVSASLIIYYRFQGFNSLLWINEREMFSVRSVHEFQNRYHQLTGKQIIPNLYGMREY